MHPKDIRAATMYEKGDLKIMIASIKLAINIMEISFNLVCTSKVLPQARNKAFFSALSSAYPVAVQF